MASSALFTTPTHGKHNCNCHMCICGDCVSMDLWVSSCVGNMTLWPQPVAADGKSTAAKQEEVLLSPAGSGAQPEKLVRRVQQQERVGVNVGSTEACEERAKAAVCTFYAVARHNGCTHMYLYVVTVHSCQWFSQSIFFDLQYHQVHTCWCYRPSLITTLLFVFTGAG